QDSDIDEFFLVLNDTEGDGNIIFNPGESSRKSSVESYERMHDNPVTITCIPEEPDTPSSGPTSSSGLSPLIETTSEDGTSESYTPESRTPELQRIHPQSPKFRQSDRICPEPRRAEIVSGARRSQSRTPEPNRKLTLTPEVRRAGSQTPEARRAGSQTPEQRRFKPRTPELRRSVPKSPDSLKIRHTTEEPQRSSPKIHERRRSEPRSPKLQISDQKLQEPPSPRNRRLSDPRSPKSPPSPRNQIPSDQRSPKSPPSPRNQRPSDPRSPKSHRPDVLESNQHSKPFLGLGKGKAQKSHVSPALVSVVGDASTLATAVVGVKIETVTDNTKPVSNDTSVDISPRPLAPSPSSTSNPSKPSELTQREPGDTIGGLNVHELAKIFNKMASSISTGEGLKETPSKEGASVIDGPVAGVTETAKHVQRGVEDTGTPTAFHPPTQSDPSGANTRFPAVAAGPDIGSDNSSCTFDFNSDKAPSAATVQDLRPDLEALATVIAECIVSGNGGVSGGGAEAGGSHGPVPVTVSSNGTGGGGGAPGSATVTTPLSPASAASSHPVATSALDTSLRDVFLQSCLQETGPYWAQHIAASRVKNGCGYNNKNNLALTLSDPQFSSLVPNRIETIVNVVHMPDVQFPTVDQIPTISDVNNTIDKAKLTNEHNPHESVVNIIHNDKYTIAVNSKEISCGNQLILDKNIDADKESDIVVLPSDCSTCDSEIFIIHNQTDKNYNFKHLKDPSPCIPSNSNDLIEKMSYINNKGSPVNREHSTESKTSDYDPDTPLSDSSFPIYQGKDSPDSRKFSMESTNTTPDADYEFGDFYENKESIVIANKCSPNDSIISDNWEWFPGRKNSNKGFPILDEINNRDFSDKVDTRKISTVSRQSTQSSGIGSMNGSEFSQQDLRKASINSVTSLAQIKEEPKKINLEKKNSLESHYESDSSSKEDSSDCCHNIMVDGKTVGLPSPIWPDVGKNIGWKDPQSVRKKVQMNKKAFLESVLGTKDPITNNDYKSNGSDYQLHKNNTRIKLLKSDRGRRLTLHTFQNIADEWKKQNEVKEQTLKTGISHVALDETDKNDSNIIRINLIRDFEKLESAIDSDVQDLKSDTKLELDSEIKIISDDDDDDDDDDNSSVAVAFDSSESIASAGTHYSSDESAKEDDDVSDSKFSNTEEIEVPIVTVSSSRDSVLDENPSNIDNEEEELNRNKASEEEMVDYVVHRRKPQITLASLKESKSLPNLSDVDEAVILDDGTSKNKDSRRESLKSFKSADTLTSLDEIIPYSNYQFSEVQFPLMVPYDRLEEQEANHHFSDEEFGALTDSDHDNDLIDLNLDLFEPVKRGEKLKEKTLSKKQKKLTKLKRKFSFNKSETPIKETITNSLQRIKDAKDKFGRMVNKTLKSESASDIFSSEYYPGGENCPELYGSHAHISCGHANVLDEIRQRFQLEPQDPVLATCKKRCNSLDRSDSYITFNRIVSRNSSKASELSRNHYVTSDPPTSPEPCDLKLAPDGQESSYSWSDADSDFEFIPMGPSMKSPLVISEGSGNTNAEYPQLENKKHYGFSREYIENEKMQGSSISLHIEGKLFCVFF
ncbi:unnamed protein product, partial [Meganyctiphanes norvegica]